MNIVLLGAPGVGKGTQAFEMSSKLNIVHISTGDIFRKNISEKTPIGLIAKSFIDKGQLVPDDVTTQIVKERIEMDDCKNGYILDGFPRTVAQAIALEKITKLDAVINIVVPLEKLMKRLTGRRVCPKCGESYHVDFLNGKNICAACQGELVQRADDNEETVNKRLNVYTNQTASLIEYYSKEKLLFSVNGDQDVNKVFDEILEALKK